MACRLVKIPHFPLVSHPPSYADLLMSLASSRLSFILGFLFAVFGMAAALYLEHVVGLSACPLCIVQRICLIGFGLVCLIAAVHRPALVGRRAYSLGALLFVLAGGAVAWRQIWLQTQPPESLPSCLPSLEYMLDALPFQEIVRLFLHGTAECAEVGWTFLHLSIPEWSLLMFIGLALACLGQLLRRR